MFKTKILKLDSSKAKKYYNDYKTAFEFVLENPISVTNEESIVYSLQSAYIPYSFYSVNSNNHFLDVQETIGGVTTNRTIIIPNGNYSAMEYGRVLSILLKTDHITYSFVYNKNSNSFYISTGAGTSALFLFQTGTHHANSCHAFLGFPMYDTIINDIPFSSGCIIMNDVYYFQVKSDISSGDNFMTGDGTDNLLDIIPISDAPLNFISYNPINPTKFLLQNNNLLNLKIALTDNCNRPVDLNGIPFLLTIRIDIIDSLEHKIAVAQGREAIEESPEKTNLQYFVENPEMVNKAETQAPVNISDYIEYQLIQKMLRKVKRKK